MKIDISKSETARDRMNRWSKIFNETEVEHAKLVMEHVVFPLLDKYVNLFNDKEFKPHFPRIITSLYAWCKGRSFEDRQYGKHGYTEIVRRAHGGDVPLYTVVCHDMDFMTHGESYGGQSGTYWLNDEVDHAMWRGEPCYYNEKGFYLNYSKTDLDDLRMTFEAYYFAKVNAEYKKIKQLDLF